MRLRRSTGLGLTLIVIALVIGCAKPPTFETPAARIGWQADQVLIRVGELQSAAIAAEANGGLTTRDTRVILQACALAGRILPAVPSGWQTTAIAAAWQAARLELTMLPATMPDTWQGAVRAIWSALKTKWPSGPGGPSILMSAWSMLDLAIAGLGT